MTNRRTPADAPFSLRDAVRCARRRPVTILVTLAVALGLATLALRFQTPVYRSTALIHLEAPGLGGGFGDLGRLMNLGGSPVVEGEIAALKARSLAATTVGGNDDPRAAGLRTLVHDSATSVFAVLGRKFDDPPADGRPKVVPATRLFATVTPERDDAPRRIGIRFLSPTRVQCTSPSLLVALRLEDALAEEFDFTPGTPFTYRGAVVTLVPEGDVTDRAFEVEYLSEHAAVERLLARRAAEESARGSNALRVTVEDSDPRRAQESLAALCDHYLAAVRERSRRAPNLSVEYIQDVIAAREVAFADAQRTIGLVQQDNPEVLVISEAAESTLQRLSELDVIRVRLRTGQRALGEVVEKLGEGDLTALALLDDGSTAGLVGSLGITVDPLTAAHVARISAATAQLARFEQLYLPDHPDVAALEAERATLVTAIRDQLGVRRTNLAIELENADREHDSLRRRLERLPRQTAQLVEPMLTVRTHEELLPFLTQSLHAARISSAAALTSAEYFDRASLPIALAAPSATKILLTGALLGLLAGLALAVYREPRGRLRCWTDVEADVDTVVLGTAPRRGRAPSATSAGPATVDAILPPASPAAEAARHLRTRIDAATAEVEGPVLVAALGGRAGRGASTLNRDLAIAWARQGRNTLLVDADLRAPTAAGIFGGAGEAGLAEHLMNGTPLDDAIRTTDLSTLDVLPAGEAGNAAGDLVSGAAIIDLRAALPDRYDRVVIDLPELLEAAASAATAGALDAVVLVARMGSTRRSELRSCLTALDLARAPLLGTVVTGTKGRSTTHPSQGGTPA